MIFARFILHYKFADTKSLMIFRQQYDNFKRINTVDDKQNFSYRFVLPDMPERMSFLVKIDCDLTMWFYVSWALFCVWPYSLWVERKISRFEVNYLKTLTLK